MKTASGRGELDRELAQALRAACGFALHGPLEKVLARRLGPDRARRLRERIRLGEASALTELVESAVVGETYFFRHPEQLAALSRNAFQPRSGALRIWSAGCATGEEAYSLAIALAEAGRAPGADSILGTDVSRRAVEVARAARYGPWSLRRALPPGAARWIRAAGDGYEVAPEVRVGVEFRVHNLLGPAPSGGPFDVVLCRNVLMYFDPAIAREILGRLAAALRPGGWLAVSPAELALADGLPLEPRRDGDAVLLQRAGPKAVAVASPPRAPVAPARPPPPRASAPVAPPAPRPVLSVAPAPAEPPPSPEVDPEALEFLRGALQAEARGDLDASIDGLRRALYLAPGLAVAHAALVPLYRRTGRPADAERARRNALQALQGLDDAVVLPAFDPITVGALRSALELPIRRTRAS